MKLLGRNANFVFAASTLLVAVASAQECSSNVSEAITAAVDNSTFFNTCAEGVTFNVTSVFDVTNFTDSDLLAFCNSSTCLEPLHEFMHSEGCLVTYEGSARNLSAEISDLHDECHDILDAAESSGSLTHTHTSGMDMSDHSHTSGMDMSDHSHSSSSSGSSSSGASSVMMAAGSLASVVIAAAALMC
ncbi:hypothetical protein BBJ29_003019 [Phytophthora kernoviae]|uniref:Elicitin n=1 Tax=Phytophthora kernoviae TaxID=325452 RepID=A0A3F2RR98_9STRA|nr:hypothetical protein BBP00_00005139 [Phytophthora kernoviae]RLN70836.1 hypothetical protein BBJ29_003019 [Phytophthora kernoviae]